MRAHALSMFVLLTASLPAAAAPCYVVYDRSDAVIFRDYSPPFDLSEPKSPERAMMRKQGQHLLIAEFDNCDAVGFISPTTGATTATVDEIVNGVRPAIATSAATPGAAVKAGIRPGTPPAARPGATAAAAKKSY